MLRRMSPLAVVIMAAMVARAEERIPSDVRDHVAQRVEQGYCPGIVVGVVDAQGTSYFSRGQFSKGDSRPANEDTILEIGSITKVFTTILLADMVERKLVALEDPVQKYLPASASVPSRGGKQITLRDLATHRSGLPRMPDNFEPKDWENPYADYSFERMLAFLASHELERDIGAEYEYSNLGVGLLGAALSHRAGKSYEQLIVERIAEPLGMKDTRITLTDEQRSRLAPGHADGKPAKNWDLDSLAGAGALRSTPRDMVKFLSANLGLTKAPLATAMQATHGDRNETGKSDLFVALGWHVWTRHGTTIIWHNGGTGGYHSFCGFRPDNKLGVVVLTNSTEDIDDIGLHTLESKFELKALRNVAPVQRAALDDYLSYYELGRGAVLHITREGDQLFAQLTGQDRYPVYAESETKFFYKVVDAQLTFVRGKDGEVDHLILHQNGDQKARKLPPDYKPPVRAEVTVDPAILAQYVGKYQLAPGAQFDVKLEGGQLKAKLSGQTFFPVFAESETKFFYKVVEAQLTFVVDSAGKVTNLILHQNGIDQTAKRID